MRIIANTWKEIQSKIMESWEKLQTLVKNVSIVSEYKLKVKTLSYHLAAKEK